ncbi:hypothetical protein BDV95DRAFT_610958 [Massariosphaeria phaeospora]|uniref:Uncharacterized protein n=1 Tax=Massariosphaeria phaeospora TaxID=100035 RepID=A0A7C8M467_9PLEO|nr:hypothetical protein BDV95DRAFT_610958 [Massariosphaeria phaeospora]
MESLSSSFTIKVNGAPIAKAGDETGDRTQAKTGSEAAVFTLKDGRLECGEWILARARREDRSFLPKRVLWFKSGADSDQLIKPVTAHQTENEDTYQLKFDNAFLMEEDGNVFADIQGDEHPEVTVEMQ